LTNPPNAPAPKVSVVLPTYRRPELLERALGTVMAQALTDWELLVIDDNGAGHEAQRQTEVTIRRLGADPRVNYVVHESNQGACAARNTGIRAARGTYVAFLDDDDAWYPHKLERQVACFEAADPEVALVYGGYRRVGEDGRTETRRADGRAHVGRNLWMRNGIGTTSVVMCRRDALLEVGGFDERLPSMQDYDLYLRLAQRYPFACVEEPVLDKHRHGGAMIGKDYDGILRANELFFEKHRESIVADPVVHHRRLVSFGHQAVRAESFGQARRLLLRAWSLRPLRLGPLVLALAANRPALLAYRVVRRRFRRRSDDVRQAAGGD
jgi:O-antigen biosynthesis protein